MRRRLNQQSFRNRQSTCFKSLNLSHRCKTNLNENSRIVCWKQKLCTSLVVGDSMLYKINFWVYEAGDEIGYHVNQKGRIIQSADFKSVNWPQQVLGISSDKIPQLSSTTYLRAAIRNRLRQVLPNLFWPKLFCFVQWWLGVAEIRCHLNEGAALCNQLSSTVFWFDLVWFDLIWFEHKVSVGIPFAVVLWSSMTWGGCNESHTSLNYFHSEHLQTLKQGNIYILKPCKDAEYAETVIVRLISSQVDDWSVITERLQAESNLISSATICYIIASTSWSRSSVGPLWHRGCV